MGRRGQLQYLLLIRREFNRKGEFHGAESPVQRSTDGMRTVIDRNHFQRDLRNGVIRR